MATLTPRGYPQPDVGGDADIWGGQLNTGTGLIDADMTANETAVSDLRTEVRQLVVDFANQQDKVGTVKWINNADPVPPAWSECDGTNGTPDLRERALVAVSSGNRGRQRGSKIWSQNSVTAGVNINVQNHTGNVGGTSITKAQLPANSLSVNGSGTYLTDRNTGNLAFDCGGSGQNVYRDTVGSTESMGSGQSHTHPMGHNHDATGSTSVLLGATYGMRAIQKTRLLVVGDLP